MTQIQIDGLPHLETTNFQVSHSSTPLSSSDSSGGVGDFTFTVPRPVDPSNPINLHGPNVLSRKSVKAITSYGIFSGRISHVDEQSDGRLLDIAGLSFAGPLNSYGVRMPPFYGTLGNLLVQMAARAGISSAQIQVDPSIQNRNVIAPGWYGELWLHLKMLCAAEKIQVSFTETGLRFEPVRQTAAEFGQDISHTRSVDSGNLAQFVEVYEYNSRWVVNQLVYPAGGWSEEVPILSVGKGEYREDRLEMNASLHSIVPPSMVSSVPRSLVTASVYCIVGDDGFTIPPAQWKAAGGLIEFSIAQDSRSIEVKLQGPSQDIIMDTGEPSQSFSLAMVADGSQYSSLRIQGTGVMFDHTPLKVPTGITPNETGNEVGVTVDNPFLSSRSKVGTAVLEAIRGVIGYAPSISVTSREISKGGMSGGDVGARVLLHGDRPFRIREINYSPGSVSYSAEDDLTFGDIQATHQGLTWGDIRDLNQGLTWREVLAKGALV